MTVFTPEQRVAHLALARQALLEWPRERRELPDGYLFHYQGDEQRFLALARFAAEEHRCCPWLNFRLQLHPAHPGQAGGLSLAVTASAAGAGKALLAQALYELPATAREQC